MVKALDSDQLKLIWLARVRWATLLAYAAVFIVASVVLQRDIGLRAVLFVLVIAAFTNIPLVSSAPISRFGPTALSGAAICSDVLVLGTLLFMSGGYTNPFSMAFLAHVALAAFFSNARWTWGVFALASATFVLLFFVHIPVPELGVHAHHAAASGFSFHLHGMLVAFLVIGFITALFLTRMSSALEAQSRELDVLRAKRYEQEKLLALATLTAGAAHELASPIGTLTLICESMRSDKPESPVWKEDIAVMEQELVRCSEILRKMRGQSGDLQGELPSTIEVAELLHEISKPFGVRVQIHAAEGTERVVSLRHSLASSLSAMIKNAVQASSDEVAVVVEASGQHDTVRFSVIDRGEGISPEIIERIGEPFFTTKDPGAGTGLGVFLVKLFAIRIGGSFELAGAEGRGTVASLTIPRVVKV
jgi:two-component system sensor histidine kinase RegB